MRSPDQAPRAARSSRAAPTASPSDLLSTLEATAQLQWANLLELQTAEFLPSELQYLLAAGAWLKSQRVLDAGCGNGYYLSQLKRFFPEKTYTGLDFQIEHIEAARNNPDLAGVDLACVDFFKFEPPAPFDMVIMRLVTQHLAGLGDVFAQLGRLVRHGGSVLIAEPEPASFLNYPPTPRFEALLQNYGAATARKGLNRSDLTGMAALLAKVPGWTLTQSICTVAPRIGPFASSRIAQIFSLWIDIFERSGAVIDDFEAVRRELDDWSKRDVAYNQMGIRLIELRRTR